MNASRLQLLISMIQQKRHHNDPVLCFSIGPSRPSSRPSKIARIFISMLYHIHENKTPNDLYITRILMSVAFRKKGKIR